MIKLLDLIREGNEPTDITWYYGNTVDLKQSDLDPFYRQNSKYNKDNIQTWDKTGSSSSGIGLYFGSNKTDLCPSCPKQYTGFYSSNPDVTQGFMYEMKLKPDAKVVSASGVGAIPGIDINMANLSRKAYDELIAEKVDAIIDRSSPRSIELNLINPDAVQYFKKIMYWKDQGSKREWFNV